MAIARPPRTIQSDTALIAAPPLRSFAYLPHGKYNIPDSTTINAGVTLKSGIIDVSGYNTFFTMVNVNLVATAIELHVIVVSPIDAATELFQLSATQISGAAGTNSPLFFGRTVAGGNTDSDVPYYLIKLGFKNITGGAVVVNFAGLWCGVY